jgi:acyl-coenzyme A synthetase/AMP-(fatty) acid ligase
LAAPGGEEVQRGEEGLLHIAGPSLFSGYWNQANDDVFFARGGRRWYNTGDGVRVAPDAGFVFVGRRDRMVKRRGYRIELAEIERGLYQHERVRDAAAISVDDAAGVRIVAYVVPPAGVPPSIVELKMFCGRVLPAYMNPDVFVLVEALPRTTTGKVDYQSLARGYASEGAGTR